MRVTIILIWEDIPSIRGADEPADFADSRIAAPYRRTELSPYRQSPGA